jgi:hypothetical protein
MTQPLDIADSLSKTELVRRFNQIQKASAEMDLRQATTIVRKKIASDAQKAKEAEKSDLLIISEDRLRENGKKRYKKHNQDDEEKNQAVDDDNKAERLDIKA